MSQRQKPTKAKTRNSADSSDGSFKITNKNETKHRKSNQDPTPQEDQNSNPGKSSPNKNIEKIFEAKSPTLKDILKVLKEIYFSQEFLSVKYDEYIIKNKMLEETCETLRKENGVLKKEVKELKERMDTNEYTLREKNIEIQGIPYNKNEKLSETIIEMGNNIGIHLKEEDIDHITRLRGRSDKPGPIIVAFTKKESKEKFMSSRRNRSLYAREIGFENSRNQIYINEDLTKQKKELLWKTRKIKKERNFKYVWCKQGNIFLRRDDNTEIIKISDEFDLAKI